jgi:putative flippase GtrA
MENAAPQTASIPIAFAGMSSLFRNCPWMGQSIFVAVGSIGLIVHMGLVWFFLHQQISLITAQIAASLLNIGINFVLNNELTFRSARLKGRAFWMSIGLFYVGCLIGLVMNWNLTMLLSSNGGKWYIASATGLLAGSIWNYWISRIWIWQVRRRRARKAGRPAELPMPVSSGIASGSVRGQ